MANERVKMKDLEEKNKDLGGQVRVCFLGTSSFCVVTSVSIAAEKLNQI